MWHKLWFHFRELDHKMVDGTSGIKDQGFLATTAMLLLSRHALP